VISIWEIKLQKNCNPYIYYLSKGEKISSSRTVHGLSHNRLNDQLRVKQNFELDWELVKFMRGGVRCEGRASPCSGTSKVGLVVSMCAQESQQ